MSSNESSSVNQETTNNINNNNHSKPPIKKKTTATKNKETDNPKSNQTPSASSPSSTIATTTTNNTQSQNDDSSIEKRKTRSSSGSLKRKKNNNNGNNFNFDDSDDQSFENQHKSKKPKYEDYSEDEGLFSESEKESSSSSDSDSDDSMDEQDPYHKFASDPEDDSYPKNKNNSKSQNKNKNKNSATPTTHNYHMPRRHPNGKFMSKEEEIAHGFRDKNGEIIPDENEKHDEENNNNNMHNNQNNSNNKHNNIKKEDEKSKSSRKKATKKRADIQPVATIDSSINWESIGGLEDHILALKEMVVFPFLYPDLFTRFSIQPPKGVLFHGPPGTGKTLMARALANSSNSANNSQKITFFMRKGADCLSKWVGEAERQLRLLFEEAFEKQPSIIFFDEIDGLAPVRSSKQDQIHSSIVSTLLALMDGLESRGQVMVIGATNRIDSIDPALRRPGRFDREFYFPLPNKETRRQILHIHTKNWSSTSNSDREGKIEEKERLVSELAEMTSGFCGADLQHLTREAALSAFRRQLPQLYSPTSDRSALLANDLSLVRIKRNDFIESLSRIIPTSQRQFRMPAKDLSEWFKLILPDAVSQMQNYFSVVFKDHSASTTTTNSDAKKSNQWTIKTPRLMIECKSDLQTNSTTTPTPTTPKKSKQHQQQQQVDEVNEKRDESIQESYVSSCFADWAIWKLSNVVKRSHSFFSFDLANLLSHDKALDEAVASQLNEASKGMEEVVLYFPDIDRWWDGVNENCRNMLIHFLSKHADLAVAAHQHHSTSQSTNDPKQRLFILATGNISYLDPQIRSFFQNDSISINSTPPILESYRMNLFASILHKFKSPKNLKSEGNSLTTILKNDLDEISFAPFSIDMDQTSSNNSTHNSSNNNSQTNTSNSNPMSFASKEDSERMLKIRREISLLRKLRLACRHSIEHLQKNKRYKIFFKPSKLDKYAEYAQFPRNVSLNTILDQIDGGMFRTFEQFTQVITRHFINIANQLDPDKDPLLVFNRCAAATDEILEKFDKLDTSVSLELSKIAQEREQAKNKALLASKTSNGLTTTTTTSTTTTSSSTTTSTTNNSSTTISSTTTTNTNANNVVEKEIDPKLVENMLDDLVSMSSQFSLTQLLECASRIRSAIHSYFSTNSTTSKQKAFELLQSNFKQLL